MSDQDGDKTAADKIRAGAETSPEPPPEAVAEAKAPAGAALHEPEAQEDEAEPLDHEDDLDDSDLEDDAEGPEEAKKHHSEIAAEPPPEKPKRRGGVVKFFAFLMVLAAAGGGGYYLWNTYFIAPESSDEISASSEPATTAPTPEQKAEGAKPAPPPESNAAPAESKASGESADSGNKPTPAAPQAVAPEAAAPAPAPAQTAPTGETEKPAAVAAKPESESAPPPKGEGETAAPAAQAPSPSAPRPPAEVAAAAPPAAVSEKPALAAAASEPAKTAEPSTPAPTPAPEPAKPAGEASAASAGAAGRQTDEALAAMGEKLAAAEATVERLSQRLQSVEGELGALKSEARAAPPPVVPDISGQAAARLAVAQSLLNAMWQGDDYSAQIAALQKFGVDPEQAARLRAGLSAPNVADLAKEFAALGPRLVESAAPAERTGAAKPPQSLKDSIWALVETEANKLVRIRPAGSAEQDAVAATVATIEKDLRAGDLAAALAERQQLPPSARSLSDRWAAGVQARLDAEAAAKAELNAALRSLTKTKT